MHSKKDVVFLIAEADTSQAALIRRTLVCAGISNQALHFRDGQETLNYLFGTGHGPHRAADTPYVLLLSIRLPKIDGTEVLRRIKEDPELRTMPGRTATSS